MEELLLLLLLGALFLVGRPWWQKLGAPPSRAAESPIEIARRRYPAGEITREQYEEMIRALGDEAKPRG